MTDDTQFKAWAKIPRLRRGCVITEKIDGTNAHILIRVLPATEVVPPDPLITAVVGQTLLYAGCRTRYITPEADNFGFAHWVRENAETLVKLGEGRHYGEWWGSGIQRTYGLNEKRFSLFNVSRAETYSPEDKLLLGAVGVGWVPVICDGDFTDGTVGAALEDLRLNGSKAAPGWMKPEGVVVFHKASGGLFKATLENDEAPKGAKS